MKNSQKLRKITERKERDKLRIPFAKFVHAGDLEDWEGAHVLQEVALDYHEGKHRRSLKKRADLVLIKPGKGIAIVECKRSKDTRPKQEMLKQILFYCERVCHISREELKKRLGEVDDNKRMVAKQRELYFKKDIEDCKKKRDFIFPIIVVDSWNKTLQRKAGPKLGIINNYLKCMKFPEIIVYQDAREPGEFARVELQTFPEEA